MEVESATPGPITEPKPNFLRLLWNLIRRPRAAYERVRTQPNRLWLLMGLLTLLLALLLVWVAAPISTQAAREAMQASFEAQAERNPQFANPEIQAQALEMGSNPLLTVVFPSLAVLVSLPLGWLLWAGALHLLGVMSGGKNSFIQMLQVVIWASLPLAIRSLIQTVYVAVSGELIANQGLSGLLGANQSVAEIIASPPGPGRLAVQTLLSAIDVFQIWNLVLIAIGVLVMGRVSGRKAVLITLAVWALFTLIRMAFAALPALFMPGMG